MPTTTILWIVLALVLALAFAAFQYLYKHPGSRSRNILFSALRFLTVFSLLLLLINPQFRTTEYYTEKPILVLAVDNSESISHLGHADQVRKYLEELVSDKDLRERFRMEVFNFSDELEHSRELSFQGKQTNISNALERLDVLYEHRLAPTVLITDGNQTFGRDYSYSARSYGQALYPVLVGDTSRTRDLSINRVHVNQYAFLENEFPVEIMLSYQGEGTAVAPLRIKSADQVLFSESVSFGPEARSLLVHAELPATALGIASYTVAVGPLEGEENLVNNSREFAIEVIDERSKVLILYDVLHPDLGALKKAISSNQQREVQLHAISDGPVVLADYQLVILYQPSRDFRKVLQEIEKEKFPFWLISGPETDWAVLNEELAWIQQEITGQSEGYHPVFNADFNLFQAEDIGFKDFPPLAGHFGQTRFITPTHQLLNSRIRGMDTGGPLLAISENNGQKAAFLLGAGSWKWRSHVYKEQQDFQIFDEFIGQLVQFLSLSRSRQRLLVSNDPLYQGSEGLFISAEYFDRNYVFDPEAQLVLRLRNKSSGKTREIPFLLNKNQYQLRLRDLPPGEYDFTVSVTGGNLEKSGTFKIVAFDVEKQFTGGNLQGLRGAGQEKNQIFFLNSPGDLKQQLLNSDSYRPVQKSRENNVSLVDWYFLLVILIGCLSAEWFMRKYYGYI